MVNCKTKKSVAGFYPYNGFFALYHALLQITDLQYRQCIISRGFATKNYRSFILFSQAVGFTAAFGDIANNPVVCNRGQYIMHQIHIVLEKMHIPSTCFISDILKLRQRIIFKYRKQLRKICHSRQIWQFRTRNPYHLPFF